MIQKKTDIATFSALYVYSKTSRNGRSSGDVGELCPAELPWLSQMRICLSRHNLLGEERLTGLSEEKGLEHLSLWAFIEFSLHRNTGRIYVKFINHCQEIMITE